VVGKRRANPRKPPEPPKPWPEWTSWNVYDCAGAAGHWIGIVEAESGEAAIATATERFGYRPSNLIVIRRRPASPEFS
jgi:hypothetical protein